MEQNDAILAEIDDLEARIKALEEHEDSEEKAAAATLLMAYKDDLSVLEESLEDDDYVATLMARKAELVTEIQKHTEVLMRAAEPRNWPLETLQALGRIHEELEAIHAELDKEMSPLQKSEEAARALAEFKWLQGPPLENVIS
jgi:hypothetical protein